MAVKCDKCKGIIPDVMLGGKDRSDCKNHIKPDITIHYPRTSGGHKFVQA